MPSPLAFLLLAGVCPQCEKKAGTSEKEAVENGEKIINTVCNNCGAVIDKATPKN